MPRPTLLFTALAVSALLAAGPAAAESFATFQIPGAQDISPSKINNVGAIAGTYVVNAKTRAFVRSPSGDITTFDVNGMDTTPAALGDDGSIVGFYSDGTVLHAFRRDASGNITPLTLPGADFTAPYGMNAAGTVVGIYRQPGDGMNIGFIADLAGNAVSITPPSGATGAVATTLNDFGASAGFFEYMQLAHSGYVRGADGTVVSFDAVPGGTDSRLTRQTEPVGIDNNGVVVGTYKGLYCSWNCSTLVAKGFVRGLDGQVSLFTVGDSRSKTYVSGINHLGQATGYYLVQRNPQRGYVRNADGTVTTFAVPNMSLTSPAGINDQGVVTGKSLGAGSVAFGFVRWP
jgi:hypothetical protein